MSEKQFTLIERDFPHFDCKDCRHLDYTYFWTAIYLDFKAKMFTYIFQTPRLRVQASLINASISCAGSCSYFQSGGLGGTIYTPTLLPGYILNICFLAGPCPMCRHPTNSVVSHAQKINDWLCNRRHY